MEQVCTVMWSCTVLQYTGVQCAGVGGGVQVMHQPQDFGMMARPGAGIGMYGGVGPAQDYSVQPSLGDGTLNEMMALRDTILAQQGPGGAGNVGAGMPLQPDIKQEGNMDDLLQFFLKVSPPFFL